MYDLIIRMLKFEYLISKTTTCSFENYYSTKTVNVYMYICAVCDKLMVDYGTQSLCIIKLKIK